MTDPNTARQAMSELSRELVKQFGYRSDCEMSIADIRWLVANIETALTQAHAQGRREGMEERDALIDALRWCSGNAFDFGECGDARQGWLNVCQPLLDKFNATAKEAGHE